MVNVGVIGLGFMGLTHIKAYRQLPNARIVAICDSVRLPADGNLASVAGNIATTEQIHFDLAVVRGYKDYHQLLANPEVQLVDICVPTPLHVPIAVAALTAGKHVLCEKPLARTSALCRAIVEVARQAPGYFMPAMCLRFWPEWVWAQQAIAQGTYGKTLAASFRRLSEPPGWSQGTYLKGDDSGGALLDMHIHDTDFVQFCFGKPRRVAAAGFSKLSGAVDHVLTQYHVDSGALVWAEGSWLMGPGSGFKMAYTIHFERAMADYDSSRGAEALRLFEPGQAPRTIACEGPDGYVGELRHMLECIETGKPPSVVTAEDGLRAVEICEAEDRSVRSGKIVDLD
ncbi:MAG: Gfo/Idh/MocA family oxidoreductase [Verrucomicrobia bacterium]|nr:Gfo/Idh/MocA family oxidoreductase [Verrucomicrobiota bacterium]